MYLTMNIWLIPSCQGYFFQAFHEYIDSMVAYDKRYVIVLLDVCIYGLSIVGVKWFNCPLYYHT